MPAFGRLSEWQSLQGASIMNRSVEGWERPAGYRMITSFALEHFRCFEKAHIDDLRRINIVVGDNATGKTSLGEAFYVATAASPYAAWFIRVSRNRLLPQQPVFWD